MKLKSLGFLTLLPLLTACAADCARTIQYEGFPLGPVTISAPMTINEERMPISWKLLRDNGAAFILTSKISRELDSKQFSLCEDMKTATGEKKDAMKSEYNSCHDSIEELADILKGLPAEIPHRLDAWNGKLKHLVKEEGKPNTAVEKKPAGDAKPAPAPEPVPAAQ